MDVKKEYYRYHFGDINLDEFHEMNPKQIAIRSKFSMNLSIDELHKILQWFDLSIFLFNDIDVEIWSVK
jgi:hypothetical protein